MVTYPMVLPDGTIVGVDVPVTTYHRRLSSINSGTGYQLKFGYGAEVLDSNGANDSSWYSISHITSVNNAIEFCDPVGSSCSLVQAWPYVSYGYANGYNGKPTSVTTPGNYTTNYRYDSNRLAGVTSSWKQHRGRHGHLRRRKFARHGAGCCGEWRDLVLSGSHFHHSNSGGSERGRFHHDF